eukprot:7130767-Prymnesium_polylepis.2
MRADDPPLCFQFFPDGRVEKQLEDVEARCPIESYPSLSEAGVYLQYAHIRPGQCIVFDKRHTAHDGRAPRVARCAERAARADDAHPCEAAQPKDRLLLEWPRVRSLSRVAPVGHARGPDGCAATGPPSHPGANAPVRVDRSRSRAASMSLPSRLGTESKTKIDKTLSSRQPRSEVRTLGDERLIIKEQFSNSRPTVTFVL